MRRHRTSGLLLLFLGPALATCPRPAAAQDSLTPAPPAPSAQAAAPPTPSAQGVAPRAAAAQVVVSDPAVTLLRALQANPLTAPYRFAVRPVGRQLALSGRVGTKQAHDAAVRTAIALGYPVRDDLTIDTLAAYNAGAAFPGNPFVTPTSYVYPPPLFGRLDDPFYGFEPPLVTYPPFAPSVAAREPLNLSGLGMGGMGGMGDPGMAAAGAGVGPGVGPGVNAPSDAIQMTLDPQGVATLQGRVPTLADRVAIGQKVASVPGISQVINLLEVVGPAAVGAGAGAVAANRETPPPPPTPARLPAVRGPAPPRLAMDPSAPPAVDRPQAAPAEGDPLARRVADSLARKPALAAPAEVRVSARDGVVTLTGRVPSAYEAMLAFRSAQQTPGARDVIDKLEFPIPDVDRPNPLREKGRPDDVEPYLLAQVRRQVGDLAHVEEVKVRGDSLEVRGTVTRAEDTPRVEATLRSIPLLRGFRLEPNFVAE